MVNLEKFEEKIVPIADKISSNKYLKAISNGFILIMPAVIGGALFVLLRSLPLGNWYTEFLENTGLFTILGYPVQITTNLMALFILIAVAFSLAKAFGKEPFSAVMIALISFLLTLPLNLSVPVDEQMIEVPNVIPMEWLGAQGIFAAILVAIVSTRLYIYFIDKKITIKLPKSVPPTVSETFSGLIPALIITSLFLIVKVLFEATDAGSLNAAIYQVVQVPLQALGTSFPALLIAVIAMNVLWLLGIHGSLIIFSVFGTFWTTAGIENLAAFEAGEELPNIVTTTFFQTFNAALGGVGATLGLCIMLAFIAKSSRYKAVGKLALPASIFNVSEPLLFGLPIIMNIYIAIPFILANVISVTIAYSAIKFGFMTPLPELGIPYTVPVGFNGFLSGGGGINGLKFALVQLINLIICTVMYYPFFKAMDKSALKEEKLEAEKESLENS